MEGLYNLLIKGDGYGDNLFPHVPFCPEHNFKKKKRICDITIV